MIEKAVQYNCDLVMCDYKNMIKDLKEGDVQSKTVLLRAVDRLHRDFLNGMVDSAFFKKNKIRVIYVTDNIDTAASNFNQLDLLGN